VPVPVSQTCRTLCLLAAAAALSAACAAVRYQPSLVLGHVDEPIPVRVELRDLTDATPPEDALAVLGGTSATASLSGDLSIAVTDAILTNLRRDGFFTEIRRRAGAPDLVLTGTIRRFHARSHLHPLGWITALVGLPIFSSRGAVDLELAFERPDGKRVAAYTSDVSFEEWATILEAPPREIGTRLDRAFSDAMRDLRGQMLRDRARLTARR
jgi:hypothetical protein